MVPRRILLASLLAAGANSWPSWRWRRSAVARRGEVVQELGWARTPTGWRITSEGDPRVIR
jgi:hypothetical protein